MRTTFTWLTLLFFAGIAGCTIQVPVPAESPDEATPSQTAGETTANPEANAAAPWDGWDDWNLGAWDGDPNAWMAAWENEWDDSWDFGWDWNFDWNWGFDWLFFPPGHHGHHHPWGDSAYPWGDSPFPWGDDPFPWGDSPFPWDGDDVWADCWFDPWACDDFDDPWLEIHFPDVFSIDIEFHFDDFFNDFFDITPGSGEIITEPRELDAFAEIKVVGELLVNVTIGETQSVSITADDNIVPLIETTVEDGRLRVVPTACFDATETPTIEITVADLSAVEIAGGSEMSVAGLANETFAVEMAGRGTVTLAGTTDTLTIEMAGAGDVYASDLIARAVEIAMLGHGYAEIHATETLDVRIFGAGQVVNTGDGEVTEEITGDGDVESGV